MHYEAFLAAPDDPTAPGVLIETTWDPESPVTFVVGEGQVLLGVDEGVVGMTVAGERLLLLAPRLAFGSRGLGDLVPADGQLVIRVYVVTKD